MNYGLPYKGSKNKIAKDIADILPSGEVFVDLFCGGCAVTHAAMLSGKFKRFIINDVDPLMPKFFTDAVNGKYKDEKRVIDRETFERLKNSDPYVKTCWSFGDNGAHYLWNDETAGAKLLACRMIMADDWHERRRLFMQFIRYLQDAKARYEERIANMKKYRAEYGEIQTNVREELCKYLKESGKRTTDIDRALGTNGMAGHYFGASQWEFPTEEKYSRIRELCPNFPPYDYWGEGLERLERLESLQGLESLESLERLERYSGDYQDVPIPEGAVVYCDPPYAGTSGYSNVHKYDFDSERFYYWLRTRDYPVYVSEYTMPDDFICIWQKEKCVTYSSSDNKKKRMEKLFVHKNFIGEVRKYELL